MAVNEVATALMRVEAALRRRPEAGVHDDAVASALWEGGTTVVASHANGTDVVTNMPKELGGNGRDVTPGWLFRAGLASCAATTIAMCAAVAGIEIRRLEVRVGSRSDTRGFLGMAAADGTPVQAGPLDLEMEVRVAANDMPPDRLRAFVEDSCSRSPIPCVLRSPPHFTLRIEVAD